MSNREQIEFMVLDAETNNKLNEFYTKAKDIILSGKRLITIGVPSESNICKSIYKLMASYRAYDIYEVESSTDVDEQYKKMVKDRKPTVNEVQAFIGGDLTAFSEASTIVMAIEELVKIGDIEGLAMFIKQNEATIVGFTNLLDDIKVYIDKHNSGEYVKEIDKLKADFNAELEKIKALEVEKDKFRLEVRTTKEERDKIKVQLESLRSVGAGAGQAIVNYPEVKTSLIKCKVNYIIYIKEVSKISFVNSLIEFLIKSMYVKKEARRVKLLIFDSRNNLSMIYRPLNVVSSDEYFSKRDQLVGKTDKLVITDPNTAIINDILTFSEDPYDVVVIYDKLMRTNKLVSGNNVFQFFVINSLKDYLETQTVLSINDKSFIITRQGSGIGGESLDIPEINNFRNESDAAKQSKYLKMTNSTGKPIIKTILEKSKIELR